jgi:hypothetical protein
MLDDINFDIENPLGTYKANRFSPLHLCNPDIDDLADTHPDQVALMELVVDEISKDSAGQYVFDLWLSSTSIFYSMATSFFWSIVCIYFLSLFAEYVAWAMIFVI